MAPDDPRRLRLDAAEYVRDSGRASLALTLNGVRVLLDAEYKPTLRARGVAYVGAVPGLPETTILNSDDPPRPYTSREITADPRIVALYYGFADAADDGTFREGPVPIPPPRDRDSE